MPSRELLSHQEPAITEYFVAPRPEDAFTVTQDTIDTVREIVQCDAERKVVDAELPLLGDDIDSLIMGKIQDAEPRLFEQCAEFLGTASLSVEFHISPVYPGRTHRSPEWHVDGFASSEAKEAVVTGELIVADTMPTEFAYGTIPYTNPIVGQMFPHKRPDSDQAGTLVTSSAVDRAISLGLLETVTAKPRMATFLETDCHIHRGALNNTRKIIPRFFMRVFALPEK